MLQDIVEVRPEAGHRLWLKFEDGVSGTLDVLELIPFDGVFAPLENPSFFDRVAVDAELGTVFWPNGADLDPDVLYAAVTGQALPYVPDEPMDSMLTPVKTGKPRT